MKDALPAGAQASEQPQDSSINISSYRIRDRQCILM
jgi:hypothetical protein